MKKTLLILTLILLAQPSFAQYQNKYPLQMTQGGTTKVYGQNGSLNGYIKVEPIKTNSTYGTCKTYNRYNQRTGTYRVYDDGSIKVLNRAKY
jgi:hypothetical protein